MLEARGTIIIMWWQGRTRVLGGHESVCLFLEKLTHRPRRQKIDLESDTPVTMQRGVETSENIHTHAPSISQAFRIQPQAGASIQQTG